VAVSLQFCRLVSFLILTASVGSMAWAEPAPQVLSTAHFQFEFPEQQRKIATRLADSAEAVRETHCQLINPCFEGTIKVQIARSEEQFLELQPHQAHIDWAAGVAYAELKLIILRVDKDILLTIEETFEHEVSHILLLQAVMQRPPRWFIEGMAIVQARQNLIERFEKVAAATINDRALSLDRIAVRFPGSPEGRALAYAQSGLFVSYLVNEFGEKKMSAFVSALSRKSDFKQVFVDVYGQSLAATEKEWKGALGSYGWLKALTDSWLMWGLAALLLVAAVGTQMRRRRKPRDGLPEEGGSDWEYRSKAP
jgi:hypothetical protein